MLSSSNTRLGPRGETAAARHLERAGWAIAARNYRAGRKEIDLIATRGGVVAFVEVKTRSGRAYGHPLESITWRKRTEIGQVAADWIARFGRPDLVYRFDAIAVFEDRAGTLRVEHVEDAWRM